MDIRSRVPRKLFVFRPRAGREPGDGPTRFSEGKSLKVEEVAGAQTIVSQDKGKPTPVRV